MARGAIVLAAAVLVGCGSSRSNDAAAEVDGAAVSRARYEDLLRFVSENPELGVEEDQATGTIPGDSARQLLAAMVLDLANVEYLARSGEAITDGDRQVVLDGVPEGDQLLDFPADVRNLVVDQQAGATARARIAAPDAAELERRYAASPAATGVMCVRHIVVSTEAEAEGVIDRLEAGDDFAEVAAEMSVEPAAVETGGALEGEGGGACLPLGQAQASLDPVFVAGAVAARPGGATGPVESSFGWHVILARPWDEVSTSLTGLYEQAAGELGFSGFLATADVAVDPRYGRWDPIAATVVAL